MPASPHNSPRSFADVSRQLLRALLRGPAGPFLISAFVVLGFGVKTWFFDPIAPRPPKGATLACRLLSVTDGDSLEVDCGKGRLRVRLWGIDAPEMAQTPWGMRARIALQRLIVVDELAVQVVDHDKYGRVVARVFSSNLDLGLELAKEGFAPVPLKYVEDERYRAAHYAARQERRGVWEVSGAHQRPWVWRRFNPRPGRSQ